MSSSSKKDSIKNELRLRALSQVKYAEKNLALWETLSASYDSIPLDIKTAFLTVKQFLIRKELDAYRNLMSLVVVTGEDENSEVAKMVIKRFLSTDMSVMHYWSHNGETPGNWLDSDEKLIRECFKEMAKSLTGKRKYSPRKSKKKKGDTEELKQEIRSNIKAIPDSTSKPKIKKNFRTGIVREDTEGTTTK